MTTYEPLNAFDHFSALVVPGEQTGLPLLEAAARLPQYADAEFAPEAVVQRVRGWCEQLRERIAPDASCFARLRLLNHFFYDELGFRGVETNYYAPENSYLHRVIERRCGIPISLAVLYLELGRAIGLRLAGVGFPGHFLVKLVLHDGAVFIDVFRGGATLSAKDLQQRLRRAVRGQPEYPFEMYLRASSDREILARMLRNLKAIHLEEHDWHAALEVLNRLIAVQPDEAQARRDRAAVFERLECWRAATHDLVAYLAVDPLPPDVAQARNDLVRLQQQAARLN